MRGLGVFFVILSEAKNLLWHRSAFFVGDDAYTAMRITHKPAVSLASLVQREVDFCAAKRRRDCNENGTLKRHPPDGDNPPCTRRQIQKTHCVFHPLFVGDDAHIVPQANRFNLCPPPVSVAALTSAEELSLNQQTSPPAEALLRWEGWSTVPILYVLYTAPIYANSILPVAHCRIISASFAVTPAVPSTSARAACADDSVIVSAAACNAISASRTVTVPS